MKPKSKDTENLVVSRVDEGIFSCVLVGRTPLLLNRMTAKAKRELLYPSAKKTAADKATNLKHDPIAEYRDAAETFDNGPTLLAIPGAAPKQSMAAAALDMPGNAKKAVIGRLSWVPDRLLPVYGKPFLFMTVTRMANIQRTPDIRTMCIVPEWIVPVTFRFAIPMLNPTMLINLLLAAGLYVGIGDGRPQKGKLSFGQFNVLSETQAKEDINVQKILSQGRAVQTKAFAKPEPFDKDTAELLGWYELEFKARGRQAA